jgi:hypothetical protein
MILDSLLKLSAAQQVTADAVSGNTIDFGLVTPKRKVSTGEPMVVSSRSRRSARTRAAPS